LDSSIPVEIEIEEDALLNEAQKTETDPIQLKKKQTHFYCSSFGFSYC
jgi:hypothetical protein